MVKVQELSDHLSLTPEGIWTSQRVDAIHWPEEGHSVTQECDKDSIWFQHRNHCLLEILKLFPPRGPLLDIGGGNGSVSEALLQAGHETLLLEPTLTGIRHAYKRKIQNLIHASFEEAHFKEGSLTAAGLFDVLEHIEQDVNFLKKIRETLTSQGMLYLTVPAHPMLWSSKDEYVGHYRRYTPNHLKQVLNAAGFDLSYFTYYFSILFLPAILIKTLPRKLGFKKTYSTETHKKEHSAMSSSVFRMMAAPFLEWEIHRIRNGRTIPFGYSCLAVAQKI